MLRMYYRLVLESGLVITAGEDWPGHDDRPNAPRPCIVNGQVIQGKVWMIGYESEIVEHDTDKYGVQTTRTVRPERYYVLMRSASSVGADSHGIKNPAMCEQCKGAGCPSCPEETQVYEIQPSKVLLAGRVQGFMDAAEQFRQMTREINQDLMPDDPDDDDDDEEELDDEAIADEKPNGASDAPRA